MCHTVSYVMVLINTAFWSLYMIIVDIADEMPQSRRLWNAIGSGTCIEMWKIIYKAEIDVKYNRIQELKRCYIRTSCRGCDSAYMQTQSTCLSMQIRENTQWLLEKTYLVSQQQGQLDKQTLPQCLLFCQMKCFPDMVVLQPQSWMEVLKTKAQ